MSSLLSDAESTLTGQLLTLHLTVSLMQSSPTASTGFLYDWYELPWLVCCKASVLLAAGP